MSLVATFLKYSYTDDQPSIINDFSLEVESNERVALVGPSGIGKTTICQLLAGYLEPDSGTVRFDDAPLPRKGFSPVQMVWQHPEKSVDPYLRMRDSLAQGGVIEERVRDELGIEPDWLNRFPGELSGGEIQRICLARALGTQTRFLIADEISTMLDAITQSAVWRFLLAEVHHRDIGMILVSHSDELTKLIATRTVELGG